LNGCYADCGCGTEYRCEALLGETFGDMLEAMARITRSQPNDAMARMASRRNRTISLDPNLPGKNSEKGSLDVDSKLAPRGAWLRQKSCQEISCSRLWWY
jgi:hypothetical protein